MAMVRTITYQIMVCNVYHSVSQLSLFITVNICDKYVDVKRTRWLTNFLWEEEQELEELAGSRGSAVQ